MWNMDGSYLFIEISPLQSATGISRYTCMHEHRIVCFFFSFSFFSSGGWVKIKLQARTLPRIRYMCFDLTHAPVATAARAAATGLVSMSTRPDPEAVTCHSYATTKTYSAISCCRLVLLLFSSRHTYVHT